MSSTPLPLVYVKTNCPWCLDAVQFLTASGIPFRQANVTEDPAAFAEMKQKSGQTRAPTLDWHGQILADFGVEELKPFLVKQGVKLP